MLWICPALSSMLEAVSGNRGLNNKDPFGLCADPKDPACSLGTRVVEAMKAEASHITSEVADFGYGLARVARHPYNAFSRVATAGVSGTSGNHTLGGKLRGGKTTFTQGIAVHVPNLGGSIDLGAEIPTPPDAVATFSGDAGISEHSGFSVEMCVTKSGQMRPYGLIVHFGYSVVPDLAGFTVDVPSGH